MANTGRLGLPKISKPWSAADDDMADKNRAQGKSKKALTKKAKLKKKEVKIMSEARDRKMKRERKFEMQKAEKVLRACRSRRGYELFQEPEKKKPK